MTPTRPRAAAPLVLCGMVLGVALSALLVTAFVVLDSDGEEPASANASATRPAPPPDEGTTVPIEPVDRDEVPSPDDNPATVGSTPSGTVASPSPAAVPDGTLVDCPTPTVRAGTAKDLHAALAAAAPGDAIGIADGTYTGAFVLARSGTPELPITVCGGRGAILDGGGIKKGYVLHLRNVEHVRVIGITVRNGQKGVMADGVSSSVVQGLAVEDIGDEAIHLRAGSSGNAVVDNTIRRTGLRRDKFGEGIYIGSARSNWASSSGGEPDRSDDNLVQGNDIAETSSEAIDVKEGTTGGRIIGNRMDGTGMTGADSLMDIKGNDWLIEGNVGHHAPEEGFQTHRILEGWGSRNTFRGNTIDVDGSGLHVSIHDASVTDNRVHCDNRTSDGTPLRTNVVCRP